MTTPTTPAAGASIPPPPQWPPEVVQEYEPLARLGRGGFASVLLARNKNNGNELVAMKVVGSASKQESGYAHREVEILRELKHPNIMKVLQFWEAKGASSAVMALSYSKGPTLQQLVDHGGALSLTFGRVVVAQLTDALAYCHSRAVVHRDIKPDNCVVTGASLQQDEIWEDTAAGNTAEQEKDFAYWKGLCQKWHLTLLDFGFARALSPDDMEKETVTINKPTQQPTEQEDLTETNHNEDEVVQKLNAKRNRAGGLDKSISHAFTRTMSALGNRLYAAPEIVNGVHTNTSRHSITASRHSTSGHGNTSRHSAVDITKTLSPNVSNYGMLADAFSLGNTIKYLMTGVPPNENVTEYINQMQHPLVLLCTWIGQHACAGNAANGASSRKIKYRKMPQMPLELATLIRGTVHPSVAQRMSVRAARRDPYIDQVLNDPDNYDNALQQLGHEQQHIQFLGCALKRGQKQQQQSPAVKPTEEKATVAPTAAAPRITIEEPEDDDSNKLNTSSTETPVVAVGQPEEQTPQQQQQPAEDVEGAVDC